MSAGTATDVIGVFATEGAKVIENRLASDITSLVEDWELYPYVNTTLLEPFTHEGKIYGVPFGGLGGAYVMTLFYNVEMFKKAGIVDENGDPKPPQTWEEFVDTAVKLTDREKGVAGFGILGDADASGWHFLNWVWQSGGEFEKKVDGKWKATFDSPEAIRALQLIKDLRWKHDVLQKNVTANNDDLFELFVSERIAMALFVPEYLFYIVEKLKFPVEKIGITLLPEGPGGRVNQMGGSFLLINPQTPEEKKKAAFKAITYNFDLDFIKAACELRKKQGRLIGIASLPVFTPEYQDKIDAIIDEYRNVPSYSEVMNEAVKHIRPEPPFYAQALYSQYLSPAVQKVLTDENADPEKIMKQGAKDFQMKFLDRIKIKK
jgi:ABC-type glycerol-3-phosphate transport system substrate-binding protein